MEHRETLIRTAAKARNEARKSWPARVESHQHEMVNMSCCSHSSVGILLLNSTVTWFFFFFPQIKK